MAAKALVFWDQSGARVPNVESTIIVGGVETLCPLSNDDGYSLAPKRFSSGFVYLRVLATGFAPVVVTVEFDNFNQEVHFGGALDFGPPNTIHLPALSFRSSALPVVPVDYPFTGALNIPDVFNTLPYGDGSRIYGPAFGCYGRDDQALFLGEYKERKYKWCFYQLSGYPYHTDYPYLELDINRIINDLTFIRCNGFGTIVNFRDDVGTDCSYLKPLADATQHLVDCVMGIFESNGVFAESDGSFSAQTYAKVESVLWQQHQLWPNAINAFHSTCQNNGIRGFGEKDFWDRVSPFVDVYFLQQDAWDFAPHDVADRAQDFCQRLMLGKNGWPILRRGVVLAEETTTATYHYDWTEQQGVDKIDQLLSLIDPRPVGFLDGGTA